MFKVSKITCALIFIGLLCSFQGYACVCSHYEFVQKYVQSDFVARVTIVKSFPNRGSSLKYKANIVIKQLFKGENVKSLWIMGSSDGKKRTSCDIYFKEGTEMLVYATLGNPGEYTFGSCSGYRVLTHSEKSGEARELAMLDFLDRNKIRTTDKTSYGTDLHDKLKQLSGINVTRAFAIYEITFESNLLVDTVKTVTGFSPEVDNLIASILKESRWVSDGVLINGVKKTVPPGSKLLVGFYYYPAEANDPSFVSEWDV